MRWQSLMLELGSPAPVFAAPDPSGRRYTLKDFAGSRALLVGFICNHCPFVLHVLDSFIKIAHDYAPRGLATVAISSNDVAAYPEDGPADMVKLALERRFGFPYLYDESQDVAIQFRAVCTPDFFLYDPQRKLYYRGQIDSSRPVTEHTAGQAGSGSVSTGADLRAALDALLAGLPPPQEQRPSMGCSMKWKADNEPEWG